MSDSDSDSSGNLTEQEDELDKKLVSHSNTSDSEEESLPTKSRMAKAKKGPPKVAIRRGFDELALIIQEKAEECVVLYNERKALMEERKFLNKKIASMKSVIERLEGEILEYLTTPDEMGKVPPNVPISGGGTFFVGYKDRAIKIAKDEKVGLMKDTIREVRKDIEKNPEKAAVTILTRMAPKKQTRVLVYK